MMKLRLKKALIGTHSASRQYPQLSLFLAEGLRLTPQLGVAHPAQEVLAVGPSHAVTLQPVAKAPAGAHALPVVLLAEAAVRRGRGAHGCLGIFDPVASKLGEDDLRVGATLLQNLGSGEGRGCSRG